MSDKGDIPRRKVLLTTGGIAGSVLGLPVVSASQSENKGGKSSITKEELEKQLAKSDVVANTNPSAQTQTTTKSNSESKNIGIFIGENKNAEVPTGTPFAIESLEEYLARNSPPGFESINYQGDLKTNEISARSSFPTYLKKDMFSFPVKELNITFNVAAGVGVKASFNGTGVSVSLNADIFINNFSVSLGKYSFGISSGRRGICLEGVETKQYGATITANACVNGTFSGDKLGIAITPEVCVDPCPSDYINCAVCQSASASLGTVSV